jgi:hypothetical protein
MLPIFLVPALIQALPALPSGFTIPDGLRIKEGTLQVFPYDVETFDVLKTLEQAPLHVQVKGKTWRFMLESSGVRQGILSLQQKLRPVMDANGWTWKWEQRGVAQRVSGSQETWIKIAPSGGAALQIVLIQPGLPRTIKLQAPGKVPEIPTPDGDFAYVTPWPGAQLVTSADSQSPVGVDLGGGNQTIMIVNWIEKEYSLPDPPSGIEFVTAYRMALESLGWEIEGDLHGSLVQLQAIYLKDDRDIRLTLRLVGNAMAISVADVGLQKPK